MKLITLELVPLVCSHLKSNGTTKTSFLIATLKILSGCVRTAQFQLVIIVTRGETLQNEMRELASSSFLSQTQTGYVFPRNFYTASSFLRHCSACVLTI